MARHPPLGWRRKPEPKGCGAGGDRRKSGRGSLAGDARNQVAEQEQSKEPILRTQRDPCGALRRRGICDDLRAGVAGDKRSMGRYPGD